MATTNFINEATVIVADWLNDVDYSVYSIFNWETNFGEGSTVADGTMLVGDGTSFVLESGETLGTSIGPLIGDLVTLGASAADGEFIVATGAGALAWESGDTVAASLLGATIGPNLRAMTSGVLDEDTMVSDSAVALATQQSIKAYVDTQDASNLSEAKNFALAMVLALGG